MSGSSNVQTALVCCRPLKSSSKDGLPALVKRTAVVVTEGESISCIPCKTSELPNHRTNIYTQSQTLSHYKISARLQGSHMAVASRAAGRQKKAFLSEDNTEVFSIAQNYCNIHHQSFRVKIVV